MTAPLEVFLAGPGDHGAWESFTRSAVGAELGHDWAFQDLLASVFGLGTLRIAARRGGTWCGVLPLVGQKSVLGSFLTSVPYLNYAGVLGDDPEARAALAREALETSDRLAIDRLELRGRDGSDLPIETWGGKSCYLLDLPPAGATLWEALGSKLRSQIKRSTKEAYAVRVAGAEGRGKFYALLSRRWQLLGSPVLPERFFAELDFRLAAALEYVLVEKGDRAVAAGVVVYSDTRAEIPWAASAPDHDCFGVNMLLYWTALERAIARGATRFDFGRSTPGSGNARFKLQWGAREVPLAWNVKVRKERGRAAERGDRRRSLAANAWRRLPRFVADRLGPILAARIPY